MAKQKEVFCEIIVINKNGEVVDTDNPFTEKQLDFLAEFFLPKVTGPIPE